ncbi:MAG: pseudouridine synthase [Gallionellales bacterium RBG_16_56_9]|nr:MAG: pseudouridine synthase [Gallionellales bacterium RBG_16_56_9]
MPDVKLPGEKLQKVLAQAGFGSRRMMEEWIAAGRVSVNGEPASLGMRVVEGDLVKAERRTIRVGERDQVARVLLYHKPEGEIVSRNDPEYRTSVFDKLPKLRGQKWIAIGRLDFNTSGLLIFTTSGELANRLMHPRFEVEREYAVRVQGTMTEAQMDKALKQGVELEDGLVKFEKLHDEGGEGFNHWYRVMLKEGRNRVVRRTFETLGLPVSRLMRVRFGMISLPPRLKRGMTAELGAAEVAQLLDWVGLSADADESELGFPASRQASPVQSEHRPASHVKAGKRAGPTSLRKSKTGVKR